MKQLSIDIWSDVMCPWCLVGWGNLGQALAELDGEIAVAVNWRPFELNPDMPEEGEGRTAHIARKYGRPVEEAQAIQGHMREAAERAGVSLDYEATADPEPAAMMWNTFAAHRLLAWAGAAFGEERQTALKLALFRAHFNERKPIGEREVLLDVAEESGLNRTAAAAALDDEELARLVRADERQATAMNITGVPAMVVEGQFLIPGAQPPEVYVNALRRVAEKVAA